ncbi:papain-like cysteine protease family protein [Longispora sp. K20-0274]|uniref:papain-like cysteine protease family protein n=1 Tax=Longispora sp. K20-0274 TaxID=3088255 RepID=UPI00399A36A0
MRDSSARRRAAGLLAGGLVALAVVTAFPTGAAAEPTPAPASTVGSGPTGWDPWPWPNWPWPTTQPTAQPTASPTPTKTATPTPSTSPTANPGGNSKLQFTELVQEQNQWCWAATGLSIAQYLGKGANVSQNQFCLYGRGQSSGTCPNQPAELSVVQQGLSRLGVTPGTEVDGSISFAQVKTEINGNRPIETGVYWTAGGGHARVIYGYDTTNSSIFFSDPWGSSQRYQEMTYNSYVSNSEFRWGGSVYQIGA